MVVKELSLSTSLYSFSVFKDPCLVSSMDWISLWWWWWWWWVTPGLAFNALAIIGYIEKGCGDVISIVKLFEYWMRITLNWLKKKKEVKNDD